MGYKFRHMRMFYAIVLTLILVSVLALEAVACQSYLSLRERSTLVCNAAWNTPWSA